MDFMSDAHTDGRRFRVLTVVDTFTREGPAARADFRFAESWSSASGRVWWPSEEGVTPDFSCPGKPTNDAFIESFNGRLHQECLDPGWFLCLEDARARIDAWRSRSDRGHPHSALGYLAPGEFAANQASRTEPIAPARV